MSQTLSTIFPVVGAKEPAADSNQPLPLKWKRSSRSLAAIVHVHLRLTIKVGMVTKLQICLV
jgi:hypothetical protein